MTLADNPIDFAITKLKFIVACSEHPWMCVGVWVSVRMAVVGMLLLQMVTAGRAAMAASLVSLHVASHRKGLAATRVWASEGLLARMAV